MSEFGPGMMSESGGSQNPNFPGGLMSQSSELMSQSRGSPDYMPPGEETGV